VIVEDAGGLASPLDWRYDYGDLAAALGLAIILVVANRAAFLDAARLTVEHGRQRNVPVCGFVLNALDHEASATVERDAEFVARATGVSCLGTVRFKEPLSLAIVERLLKAGHDLNPDAER
jgi:dethiobiotin synthetase